MAPSLSSLPLPAVLLILCAMLRPAAASCTGGGDLLMLDRFHRWMSAHGRSYPSADEKLRRLEVYRRNVEFIDATNRDSERLGYELGENDFTDLTNEEFSARYGGGSVPPSEDGDGAMGGIITTLAGDVCEGRAPTASDPQSFDWRDEGAVTPAKFQGSCGACWAFSAVAAVESLHIIKGGQPLDLSEQEVLDCDVLFQKGCSNGYPAKALRWIRSHGGIVTQKGQCTTTKRASRVGKFTSTADVTGEPALKAAVLKTPVVVHMDSTGKDFQSYKTGVYKGPCSATKLIHAVLLVGYGVSGSGEEYWILKNSWGQNWGQKGFFFMRRGADGAAGMCGVAKYGVYPV